MQGISEPTPLRSFTKDEGGLADRACLETDTPPVLGKEIVWPTFPLVGLFLCDAIRAQNARPRCQGQDSNPHIRTSMLRFESCPFLADEHSGRESPAKKIRAQSARLLRQR